VFGRFKTADEAEKFLQARRQEYDAAVAYRQKIAEIYQARTTRRC
jgi:prefoldin subunit 5